MARQGDGAEIAVRAGTSPWPFVGREAEMARIQRGLNGRAKGIMLSGPPGVGKTRLLTETLRRARHRGQPVQLLRVDPVAARVPLGAFANVLPAAKASSHPLELLARASRALGLTHQGARLVLGVDDVHLIDDASAALVHQLAGTGRVALLAVMRTGVPTPDAITALWRDGLADRMEVGSLDRHHVEELLHAGLGRPVSTQGGHFFHRMTQGNPLFLREVVMAGLQSGALADDGFTWNWHGPLQVCPRLLEVVESSVGALDPAELAILEAVAQTEPLEARFLEKWFTADALQSVERRGLIVTERDGRRLSVRLTNPLHSHLLREGTPELRARALRRQLADGVIELGARRERDTLRIAASRLDGGGCDEPDLMLRAGQIAHAEHDDALAERLARAAVEAGAGPAAGLTLSQAMHAKGRHDEAMAVLAELDRTALDEPDRASAAALEAQMLCWGHGQISAALQATQISPGGTGWQLTLAVLQATILLVSGEIASALQIADGILEWSVARDLIVQSAAFTAGIALAARGRAPRPRQLALAERCLDAEPAADGGVPVRPAELIPLQQLVQQVTGGLDAAAARHEWRYRTCLELDDTSSATAWAALLGRTELDRGRVRSALRLLHEATMPEDQPGVSLAPLAWLAEASALLGDLDRAGAALARADRLRTPANVLFEPDLALARAWMAVARGDPTGAVTHIQDAAAAARRAGNLPMVLTAFHTAVRLGGAQRVTAELHEVAARVDGQLARAYAAHAEALVTGDGLGLDRVAEAFRAEGAMLLAAEASAEAVSAYYNRGRRGRSQSAGVAAYAMLEQCGGVRTPALIGLKAPSLTQREREVAALAAQGLSSRTIAERLRLSVRTVDNHLQMTYGKLGINGRGALADALAASAG